MISLGLSIRSVCWGGEKILVGTNGGEVFEVTATDKEKPVTLVQVSMHWLTGFNLRPLNCDT